MILNRPGTVIVTASLDATTYYKAASITTTFTYLKLIPSISNFIIPDQTWSNSNPYIRLDSYRTIVQSPLFSNNIATTYVSSDTSIAKIGNPLYVDTLNLYKAGTCTITATTVENDFYSSVSAETTLKINKAVPTVSTSGFINDPSLTFGNSNYTIPWNNNTISDGKITHISSDPNVVTIVTNSDKTGTVKIINAGVVKIKINVAEGTNHLEANSLEVTWTIKKKSVSFGSYTSFFYWTLGTTNTLPKPTSASTGNFIYTANYPNQVTISGNQLTLRTDITEFIGSIKITMTQEATTNYESISANLTITVNKLLNTVIASGEGYSNITKTYSTTPFTLNLTSNNPLPFTLTNGNTSIISISSDNIITPLKAGSVNITVKQPESLLVFGCEFNVTVNILRANLILSNFVIPNKFFGEAPFTITQPTLNLENTGSIITYESFSPSSAEIINNNAIVIKKPGFIGIRAYINITPQYSGASITAFFTVTQITKSSPVVVNTASSLINTLSTLSSSTVMTTPIYMSLSTSVELSAPLVSSTKVISLTASKTSIKTVKLTSVKK